jgi:hypothetical protein
MAQGQLLRTRRFAPFFWTQFLGALNDNVFKNALVILFAFGIAQSSLDPTVLVNLAGGVFIFPFFLFSATSDSSPTSREDAHHPRRKLLEIGIMASARRLPRERRRALSRVFLWASTRRSSDRSSTASSAALDETS